MIRFAAIFALLSIVAQPASSSDAALALADRATFPLERQPWLRYVTTEPIRESWRDEAEIALRFVVPSTSRTVVLERHWPVRVDGSDTLWRLDLLELQWDDAAWRRAVAQYPYRLGTVDVHGNRDPLTVRADWLVVLLSDARTSPAYYEFLYGGKAPKTRDEALKTWGVSFDKSLQFGLIEERSGVSVQGTRLIRAFASLVGPYWLTEDAKQLDAARDPIEQPENDAAHDGEEGIGRLQKLHAGSGTRGHLQHYLLANGQQAIVNEAPADLVVDHTGFRQSPIIAVPGGCYSCHGATGLNPFKTNGVRDLLASGVLASAPYEDQQAIEAFHLTNLDREVQRHNEDYAAIVTLATGVTPAEVVQAFQTTVAAYDSRLTLADSAHELGCDPAELKLALAWASARDIRLGARISSLAHGGSVPRRAWEQHYLAVEQVLAEWEQVR